MNIAKVLISGAFGVTLASSALADPALPRRGAQEPARAQYLAACATYGAGFFALPGDTGCLRIGGLILADWAVTNTPDRYNIKVASVPLAAVLAGGGYAPVTGTYVPGYARDAVSSTAIGRLELDSRTPTPWGTVRAYLRTDTTFGSGAIANSRAFPASIAIGPTSIGQTPARETGIINKAFVQFAGITAGRIQSMFDFYADAVGYTPLRGSSATVNAIAYTATLGGGLTATLSAEDTVSRRAPAWSVVSALAGGVAPTVQFSGTRIPDMVANVRLEQPWGAAQLSAAAHQLNTALWVMSGIPPVSAAAATSSFGFALQGGVKFNLDALAPGDQLWLQATYSRGAISYVAGTNFLNAVDTATSYGANIIRISSGNGWNGVQEGDCVWVWSGACDKSTGFAALAALRHYWTPSLSSTLTAGYYRVTYSAAAQNGVPGAIMAGSTTVGVGMTNYRETSLTSGLIWSPVKGLSIGAEGMWLHGLTSRPVGLTNDIALALDGVKFRSQADVYRGRLRMVRSF